MPEARDFLFSLEQIGIKLGLEQIRALVEALGRPDRSAPSLIVAGTNGKGSVTAMIERGLRAAGHRTGRYTSPHLVDLEERFAIDGARVSPAALDRAIERVRAASTGLPAPPSFFEATTAAAFEVFRDAAVDVAVLEVGLGGRLDATNVVDPIAAAITSIDFDHEHFLGDTLEAIAWEKAGVIKPGALVVLGSNPPTVEAVIADACAHAGARLVRVGHDTTASATMVEGSTVVDVTTPRRRYRRLALGLRGRHQIQNALTAIRLLEELSMSGAAPVDESAIRTAVEDVTWPGRLEVIAVGGAEVLLDGAHNPAGAAALAAYVREAFGRRLPMVVGVMRDKKVAAILAALAPAAAHFVLTAPASSRAMPPAELAAAASVAAPDVPRSWRADPLAAIADAAAHGRPVVVAGSLYLVGEIRAGWS